MLHFAMRIHPGCGKLFQCLCGMLLLPWLVVGDAALASAADAARRPNILLLLTDDQRPDTIHALGNKAIRTPNLDRLVREGTAFTRAICANPICTPSRAEVLTGVSSFRNGVLDFGRRIDPQLATWAGTLQQAGYVTWYVGKWHNDGRPHQRGYTATNGLFAGGGGRWAKDRVDFKGFAITGYRGWIFQDDEGNKFPDRGVGLTGDISARFADAAIELINRKPDKPFFLHVNFTAPHDPLLMPTGYEGRYRAADIALPANYAPEHPFDHGNARGRDEVLMHWPRTREAVRRELAMYYTVIDHLDAQIGRVLKALEETRQAENTIVVFTSDHGLAVGSHGLRGKQNMYEHTIGVPLVIRGPGIAANVRSDAQCYLRDLFPTTCELAGLEIPETVDGRSLAPVLRGEQQSIYPHVFGYFRNFQRMIRTERWKLIHYPQIDRTQLFDLAGDPHELTDPGGPTPPMRRPRARRCAGKLTAWQREVGDPALQGTE